MGEAGITRMGGQRLRAGGSLGLCVLWPEVSMTNTHIGGESQAPCRDLAFCKESISSSDLPEVAHIHLHRLDLELPPCSESRMFPLKRFLLPFTGDVPAWIIRANPIWGWWGGGVQRGLKLLQGENAGHTSPLR